MCSMSYPVSSTGQVVVQGTVLCSLSNSTHRIHLPPQIVICFIKPVLPWRSPGVHFLDISNHGHFMRKVGGNDDNIARIHIHYFFLVCPKPKAHLTRNKLCYLFVNMMVLGHEKTILEFHFCYHQFFSPNYFAKHRWIDFFSWNGVPVLFLNHKKWFDL